ncbi:MAG: hypothetical protein SFY56_14645 [Bacteroidota bacterium]|nr:hypothetical protein [Bacteroidota bacterium]
MSTSIAKTILSFKQTTLFVKFSENSIIDVDDIIYAYCYGIQESKRKPFAVLFDSSSNHELTEEAVVYLANNNLIDNIIAVAFISKTLLSKIRFNLFLIFEKPPLKPKLFNDEVSAIEWLNEQIKAYTLSKGPNLSVS